MAALDFKHLARFLAVPLIATALVVLLFMGPPPEPPPRPEHGANAVRLQPPSSLFGGITRLFGHPAGIVWYSPAGDRLALRLEARGLHPGRRYILELDVDGTIYDVASHPADSAGRLRVDTALTRFAEGVCVGRNYHPPRPLPGAHAIRFWLKRDGNPRSGSESVRAAGAPPGTVLPCAGNGDDDYGYALMDDQPSPFSGTENSPAGSPPSPPLTPPARG